MFAGFVLFGLVVWVGGLLRLGRLMSGSGWGLLFWISAKLPEAVALIFRQTEAEPIWVGGLPPGKA